MKAKELIYNLKTALAETGSLLNTTTDQHLMFMLDEARATLASQKMNSHSSIDIMAQNVDVKPIAAPTTDLGTVGKRVILKVETPPFISYIQGNGIFTVGTTDASILYTRTNYSELRTILYRKYTAFSPKWCYFNKAIYIINNSALSNRLIRVRGVVAEPYKVEILNKTYNPLDPFNFEYPLSLNDVKTVYQIAMSGTLGFGDTAAQAINSEQNKRNKSNDFLETLKGLANNSNTNSEE